MKLIWKIFLLVFVFTSLAVVIKKTNPKIALDGYQSLFHLLILKTDDTTYTSNYSDEAFIRIKKGTTYNEVIDHLGKPFNTDTLPDNTIRLAYSRSVNDTHYRIRQLYFQNNKVVQKEAYFYID